MTTKKDRFGFGGPIISTDGSFFEDMRAKERRIIAEIDPDSLDEFDKETERMNAENDETEDTNN